MSAYLQSCTFCRHSRYSAICCSSAFNSSETFPSKSLTCASSVGFAGDQRGPSPVQFMTKKSRMILWCLPLSKNILVHNLFRASDFNRRKPTPGACDINAKASPRAGNTLHLRRSAEFTIQIRPIWISIAMICHDVQKKCCWKWT